MTTPKTPRGATPSREITGDSKRKMIPASKIGISLTISDEALEEFDRIQEKTIKAAQEDQKFSWR